MFHDEGPHFSDKVPGISSLWLRAIRDIHPHEFVDQYVYCPYPAQVETMGFKVFVQHYQDPRFHSAIGVMNDHPDLTLIRLHRKNKLEAFLSLQQALATGQWALKAEQAIQQAPLDLDAKACEEAFTTLIENDRVFEELCKDRLHLSIEYNELLTDFDGTMKKSKLILVWNPKRWHRCDSS